MKKDEWWLTSSKKKVERKMNRWIPKHVGECVEVWTTKDGRRIRVCDMSDEHVRYTLNMILRKFREDRGLGEPEEPNCESSNG